MGADGGIVWLRLREGCTEKELNEHVWFLWQVQNTQSKAIQGGEFVQDLEGWTPSGGPWVEGGYGTDCEFDFTWLSEFASHCTDEEDTPPGFPDPRDMTFRELEQDLLTDPNFKLWSWSMYRLPWGGYEPWWNRRQYALLTDALVSKLQREIPRESDGFTHKEWKARYVPERFWDMTVREWGQQLARIIVPNTEVYEETWT